MINVRIFTAHPKCRYIKNKTNCSSHLSSLRLDASKRNEWKTNGVIIQFPSTAYLLFIFFPTFQENYHSEKSFRCEPNAAAGDYIAANETLLARRGISESGSSEISIWWFRGCPRIGTQASNFVTSLGKTKKRPCPRAHSTTLKKNEKW